MLQRNTPYILDSFSKIYTPYIKEWREYKRIECGLFKTGEYSVTEDTLSSIYTVCVSQSARSILCSRFNSTPSSQNKHKNKRRKEKIDSWSCSHNEAHGVALGEGASEHDTCISVPSGRHATAPPLDKTPQSYSRGDTYSCMPSDKHVTTPHDKTPHSWCRSRHLAVACLVAEVQLPRPLD